MTFGIVAPVERRRQIEIKRKGYPLLQERLRREKADEGRKPRAVWWDALVARSGIMAYLPITLVTIGIFCGSSWQIFLPTTDPARYQCYALTFWLGSNATHLLPPSQCAFLHIEGTQPPFRMLPLEYPPLTLLPFSLALLAPLLYYQMAFTLLMALTSVLIYWLLLRYGPRGAALVFALYIFIGALATAQLRFDFIPAALTLLSIIAAERRRWTSAYVALAFGVLLKLYPILLLPALFIAEQRSMQLFYTPPRTMFLSAIPRHLWLTLRGASRWQWKNLLLFLSIILGVTGAFALLNFREAILDQVSYFVQRPIQVEATGSMFLWIATHFGFPLQIIYSYGSLNIINRLNGLVSLVSEFLFITGCASIVWTQWRARLDLTQVSIALLLIFIATGKVFSPQYLIWLMPLLAYAGAFNVFWLFGWGTVSVLTTFINVYLYTRPVNGLLIPFVPGFIQAVSVRNAFFVLVTLAYLFNWFEARKRKPLPPLWTGKETQPLSL